jgi:hypothetical protein
MNRAVRGHDGDGAGRWLAGGGADAQDVSNTGWPTFSDGRLALGIFQHRLAISPRHENLKSIRFDPPAETSGCQEYCYFEVS